MGRTTRRQARNQSAAEDRQVGIRWPGSVVDLADSLVDRANESGANTSRKELLAALVLQADALDSKELLELTLRLRRSPHTSPTTSGGPNNHRGEVTA